MQWFDKEQTIYRPTDRLFVLWKARHYSDDGDALVYTNNTRKCKFQLNYVVFLAIVMKNLLQNKLRLHFNIEHERVASSAITHLKVAHQSYSSFCCSCSWAVARHSSTTCNVIPTSQMPLDDWPSNDFILQIQMVRICHQNRADVCTLHQIN